MLQDWAIVLAGLEEVSITGSWARPGYSGLSLRGCGNPQG